MVCILCAQTNNPFVRYPFQLSPSLGCSGGSTAADRWPEGSRRVGPCHLVPPHAKKTDRDLLLLRYVICNYEGTVLRYSATVEKDRADHIAKVNTLSLTRDPRWSERCRSKKSNIFSLHHGEEHDGTSIMCQHCNSRSEPQRQHEEPSNQDGKERATSLARD